MTVAPVCSVEGFTLQNDCLLECQGLKLLHGGQCKDTSMAFGQPSSAGVQGTSPFGCSGPCGLNAGMRPQSFDALMRACACSWGSICSSER